MSLGHLLEVSGACTNKHRRCYYILFFCLWFTTSVHAVVRALVKLYNSHALDLTIASTWVRSSS